VADHIKLISKGLKSGTRLNITDYGDLFVPVIEGEPRRIARMHKGIWFSGHLLG